MSHLKNGLINVTPHGKYITMAQTNATQSPLLRVPAELRTKIWQSALSGHTVGPIDRRVQGKAANAEHSRKVIAGIPKTQHFALLRVSRQIYTETAVLLYELSVFSFDQSTSISAMVRAMPHWKVALMRNVRKFSMNTSGPASTAFFRDHFPILKEVEIYTQVVPPKGEADDVTAWLLELGVAVKVKRYSHMRMWSPPQWRRHKILEQARSDSFPWRDCF